MKELYLTIVVLCFLVAVMVICVNKSIKSLKELRDFWKEYKQDQIDFENAMKEFYRKKSNE